MKNRIIGKLRSRTGASILFALFLFLVCAVLASVALTAATASAGRMSEIAKADQRYYAVTSAAELMVKLIDGKSATIVEKSGTPTTYTVSDSDPIFKPILENAAKFKTEKTEVPHEYDLSFSGVTGEDYLDALTVEPIYVGYFNNGDIEIWIEKDGYVLTLNFVADAFPTEQIDRIPKMAEEHKLVYEDVTTTTTNITWKLADIKTGEQGGGT